MFHPNSKGVKGQSQSNMGKKTKPPNNLEEENEQDLVSLEKQ